MWLCLLSIEVSGPRRAICVIAHTHSIVHVQLRQCDVQTNFFVSSISANSFMP
jgi:hypothetical protein